jgi:hypothetical protein
MGCFSRRERDDAKDLETDAAARLAGIDAQHAQASTPAEHRRLGLEAHNAHRDLGYASFVLGDDDMHDGRQS